MKKSVTVVSNVRINQLLCCSAAVLLAACGGGATDTIKGQPDQTAAVSYDSASRYANSASTDTQTAATTSPSDTEADSGATVAATDNSADATTIPSSTEAASDTGPDGSTRLLAESTAVAAAGNHLYVAPTGSDSNPGTQAAPLKTIARADYRARAGYTIHVAPGIYKVSAPSLGSNGILTTKSGTSTARIKFVSDVKWGAKIIVSGTGVTWHSKGSYVDIDGFEISGSGRQGILAAGRNLTITNNFVHDLTISGGCNGSGGAGINTYGLGTVTIERNIVRNIGYKMIGTCSTVQGIYNATANNVIKNNIVSGVASVGIQQWHGGTASTIVNNTIFHNKVGILIGQGDGGATSVGSQNNYVANNIIYDNITYGINEYGKIGSNNRYVNNLVSSSGAGVRLQKGVASGTISSNPLFVNYLANGTGNYRVYSGSPAIDRGTANLAPKTDIAGVARPRGSAIDIGAYEF
jgi:hypothetical protein